jgi:hypothetical protein
MLYKKIKMVFLILVTESIFIAGCSDTSQLLGTQQDNAFGKYKCTNNCSGHKAGYSWAKKRGVDNLEDCSGNSQSFIEGCMEYAETY